MNKRIKFGVIVAMTAASGFVFTACQDGEPGPTGAQGEKGAKGDVGDTGANGVGYDELTRYGNMVVRYKGTRTDGVAFDKMIDFKFSPSGPDAGSSSSVWNGADGSAGLTFAIDRYSAPAMVMEYGANSLVGFLFYKPDDEEEEGLIYVTSYIGMFSDDMKFFILNLGQEYSPAETVTEFSFTSATGELKFKFHVVVPADENETDHDLEITADVNVKVIKAVEPIDSPD